MSFSYIRDAAGKVIGSTRTDGSRVTTYGADNKLVARVVDGRTYDNNSRLVGKGDLSLLKIKK